MNTTNTTADQRTDDKMSGKGGFGMRLRADAPRFGMVALLFILIIVFSLLAPDSFATAANLRTILVENAILTILALAVMIPLVANEFDLSIASVLAFAAMLAAGMPTRPGLSVPVMIVAVLLVGVLVGIVHSVLIVKFELPSVVVTLGTSAALTGLVLWYSDNAVIYTGVPEELTKLGSGSLLGIPLPVICMVVVAAVAMFIMPGVGVIVMPMAFRHVVFVCIATMFVAALIDHFRVVPIRAAGHINSRLSRES